MIPCDELRQRYKIDPLTYGCCERCHRLGLLVTLQVRGKEYKLCCGARHGLVCTRGDALTDEEHQAAIKKLLQL